MKKNFLLVFIALLVAIVTTNAQSICTDWNGYVDYKNVGNTGYYTLLGGFEDRAAQTYHYNSQGKINQVSVYGNFQGITGGVPLRIAIHQVDGSGRPTTVIQSVDTVWWWFNNTAGFMNVSFGAGVTVSSNFAVSVSIRQAFPFGNSFQVKYTGNGEGLGKDLASLAGPSTGGNWVSALTDFTKDGDFYLVPQVSSFNIPSFQVATSCIAAGANIAFTNTSQITRDSMFNRIGLAGYNGSNKYFAWNFGDGSPVSNAQNPNHSFANPGVYNVSLTTTLDGWDGVCSETYSMQISVGLSVSDSLVTSIKCNSASTGVISAKAIGGATPYQYSVDGGPFQSSATFSNLSAGSHTLRVRDALGCESSKTFTLTEPAPITFAEPLVTNASCGNANGQIQVSVTGGTGTKRYRLGTGAFQNSGTFSGLAAGTYTITARDANSCLSTIQVSVNDQGGPQLTVTSTTNVSCHGGNDGSIVLTATGGSGVLQYSINGGSTYQASGSFLNLPAGVYGVLVKDAANCKTGTIITIQQPTQLRVVAEAKAVSCNGGSNGQINIVSGTGGIGALSYSINGVNFQSSTTFNGLVAGNYTVTIRDVTGCTATTSIQVPQPSAITANVVTDNPDCNSSFDGSIQIAASGGNGLYSYSLDGINYQPSGTFNYLPAGSYNVYARDRNGCIYSSSILLTSPPAIAATVQSTNSTCGNNNGAILVTASGGSGSGYQYSLNGSGFNSTGSFSSLVSGSYFITIKDGANCSRVVTGIVYDSNGPTIQNSTHTNVSCNAGSDGTITIITVTGGTGALQYGLNGSNWQSSNTFAGLQAGTYTIMVKDANGCVGSGTEVLTQPAPININSSVIDLTCYGVATGRITITAIGGAGTLSYSVNNGNSFQSSNVFNNLSAGTFTLVVRDAAGCLSTTNATVTEPAEIKIASGVLDVICHNDENGVISVNASGGTGVKVYSLDGTSYQSNGAFQNLNGGNYTIYVKDANGCVVTKAVTVIEPTPLSASAIVDDVSCAGGSNGSVNLTVNGGVGGYTYNWNERFTTQDLVGINAGNYTVTIQDANGCSLSATYVVSQPAMPLIVNGTITASSGSNGAIDITVTGGTSPYSFDWSNGATDEDITALAPGNYSVEVTDYQGCVTSNSFTVDNLLGIENETTAVSSIRMYPNPASTLVVFETENGIIEKVEVFNMLGQVVHTTVGTATQLKIPVQMLEEGVYVVRITANNKVTTRQLNLVR